MWCRGVQFLEGEQSLTLPHFVPVQGKICAAADTEKGRKDYAFWRQLKEKSRIIPGCTAADTACLSEF